MAPKADVFADRVRLVLDQKRHPDGKRWTQKDLAEAIGQMPNTVNGWLNRGVMPPAPTRRVVAQVLGVPQEWLEGEVDELAGGYVIPVVPGVAFPVRDPAAFEPHPAYQRRLPPRAYELVYSYLRQLEEIKLPRTSIEDAERSLVDAAYHRLTDPAGRTEDEMVRAIRAAWRFVLEMLGPDVEAALVPAPATPIVDTTTPVPRDGVIKNPRRASGTK